jgi:hypothetical protein
MIKENYGMLEKNYRGNEVLSTKETTIDITGLQEGVYFVQVKTRGCYDKKDCGAALGFFSPTLSCNYK